MPNSQQKSGLESDRDVITVGSLLADIRRANITIQHADLLVAAIRLRASSLLWETSATQSDPAIHPVTLPSNMNVTVPSDHEISRYNGFVYIHPAEESIGPWYVITRGRAVGVISNWINVAPLVIQVKGAVYVRVKSVDRAYPMLLNAIDDNAVLYLK